MASVKLPDGTTVSEEEFRQRIASGQLAAGPGGSAEQQALNTGVYSDPYAGGSSNSSSNSSSNTSNSGSSNQSSGTVYNTNMSQNSGLASSASTGAENVYGMRPNDDYTSWAKRSFAQGTADFGPSAMNPYIDQNANASGPYQQWFQSRYGTSVPTNSLVAAEIAGQPVTGQAMQSSIQGAMQGNGQPGPSNFDAMRGNLQGLQGMLNKLGTPNNGGLNTDQVAFAQDLKTNPQLATQIIMSQMMPLSGGFGMGAMANMLNNLATHYYNNEPAFANTNFYNKALSLIGM